MNAGVNSPPLAIATSLLRYAPGLVALVIVIADSGQTTDSDLWGHIRFGQAVIAQHHLILRDPYSYTVYGLPWSNHEWLTEVVMAAAYNSLGVVGLKLWKFACVTATMLLVVMGLAETRATPTSQLNTLTLVAIAMMPQMEFRPQLFTFMLFAAVLTLLARDIYRGSAPLWLVVPIMALWANLHGGFIMGIAVLAIYAGVTGLCDLAAGAGLGRATRLGALMIAALAATMVTPYGLETWSPVLHALRNPMTRIAVTDWQPLVFAIMRQWQAHPAGVIYMLCAVGLMFAFIATVALERRGGDLALVIIAAVMCVAAFVAVRNLPLAIIACASPLARHSSLLMARVRERATAATGAKFHAPPQRSATSPWLATGIAVVLALYSGIFSPRLRMDKPYPSGAVEFLRAHDLHGNILGDFGWGEYLIWHTSPASKVFIDGRYDTVYPYALINRYIGFYFDREGTQALLTAYPHDLVLIPSTSRAYKLMQRQTDWKLIYRDSDSALFARVDSAAAKIPGAPVAGDAPKVGYFP
jgi:hypothetical protein